MTPSREGYHAQFEGNVSPSSGFAADRFARRRLRHLTARPSMGSLHKAL